MNTFREYYRLVETEFNEKADTYDLLHAKRYSTMGLNEMLRRRCVAESVNVDGKLLSIGCGTCWYLDNFSKRLFCVGVDISHSMLKQCNKDKYYICRAYGEELPIKKETFNCILCINMFQYVKNTSNLLFEIKRIIKKDGIVIFDFKNILSLRAAIHFFVRLFRKEYDSDREKRYSIFEIKKFITDYRFKVYRIRGMEFHFFQTNSNSRSKLLIKILYIIEYLLSNSPLKFFSGRLMVCMRNI